MILGIISDVHSNSFALADMHSQQPEVDQWICLGDFSGLLPMVNETIDLLSKHHVICIKGDHEESLIEQTSLKQSVSASEVLIQQRQILSKASKKWLQNLESEKKLTLDNVKIFLTHNLTGTNNTKKYAFDFKYLEEKYSEVDIVLFGHTHLPFYWEGKKCLFINPGSLGFPISRIKQGSYVLLNTKTLQSKFNWVNAHTEDCIDVLEKCSYPKRIIQLIKENTL